MNLAVYDISGKKVGSYDIDPAELAPSVSKQLLHDAVVMYQANQRQGTMRTKTRGEVAGIQASTLLLDSGARHCFGASPHARLRECLRVRQA